jgi:hypothetical protein
MRCYNFDTFGHKSQDCKKSRRQPMKNNTYKSGRKSNELWKKIREDKSQRKNVENNISSNRFACGKIWRTKYEEKIKKDDEDLAPKKEEIDNNKLMDETPNKECEIQSFAYDEKQAQGRITSKEEYEEYYGAQNSGDDDELSKTN